MCHRISQIYKTAVFPPDPPPLIIKDLDNVAVLMFKAGRKVELSFSQFSYRDAWFPGTILQDLGNGRFLTEYCSADNNNRTKPLKVAVDLLHIRPCPPVLQDRPFVLLEKVDAYFNFGWWSGVITRELEDNSYVVFFKHTKKVKEFRHSELRHHMEWKDGKWLTSELSLDASVLESFEPPHKQHNHEKVGGTSVFVPLSNSGNRNDTLISKRNHQFEQFTSPVSEKPAHGIRSVSQKRMHLSELHDVVSLLPKKRKEGNVVEANQKDKHSRSSSKSLSGCLSPGSVGNMISFAVQSAADAASSDNSLSGDRTVNKQGKVGSTTTRIDDIVNATSGSKQSSLQVENPEPILGGIQSFTTRRVDDIVNATTGSKQSSLQVENPEPILGGIQSLTTTRVDDIVNATSGSKQSSMQVENPEPILGGIQSFTTTRVDDIVNSTSGSKQSSLQVENPEPIQRGNEGVAAVRNTAADNIQNWSGEKRNEHHVIVGLPCVAETTGVADLLTRKSDRTLRSITKQLMKKANDQIHQLDDDSLAEKLKKDSKLSESLRRRRGRPRKTPAKVLHNSITRSTRNGDADSDTRNCSPHEIPHVPATSSNQGDNTNIFSEEDKLLTDDETNPKNRSSITVCGTLAKKQRHEKAASSDLVRMGQEISNETGRTKSLGETLMPQVDGDGSFNVSGTKEIINLDSNKEVVTEAPNNEIDYEHVTAWIPELHSPPIHDGPGTSPVSTVEQCTEERLDTDSMPEEENADQTKNGKEVNPSLIGEGSVSRSEQPNWLKRSVLWKTIESMEVFQRLPQKPHFEPLLSFKESSREGLAIGYMVTFSSMVEKTSNLQFNDDKSVTDDILETLDDLEKHGFDVQVVRDRITGLLTLKNKQGELVEKADEVNSQILVHSNEKTRLDEEIHETSEKIKKLQEKLSAAEVAKEKENVEIESLLGKLLEAEQGISSLRREFESKAASSFQ